MPSGPKWDGMNRHARDAAARDQEREREQKARAAQAREDAMWADDRSSKQKKAEDRRAEENAKAEEARRRKEQLAKEYEAELAAAGGKPTKVAKRDAQKEAAHAAVPGSLRDTGRDVTRPPPIHEGNLNRAPPQSASGYDATTSTAEAAGGSSAADKAKAQTVPDDRHIGKRARVAYKKFVEQNMPLVKADKKLRRSQYNDILWAMWQKSPENPFVQRAENRAEEAQRRQWFEAEGDDSADEGEGAAAAE